VCAESLHRRDNEAGEEREGVHGSNKTSSFVNVFLYVERPALLSLGTVVSLRKKEGSIL
jgi:hypothetical protein